MIEGSCHCGAVRYEYVGKFGTITICHCADCRQLQGTGVVAAPADARTLRWTAGQELITEYASSADKLRAFCSRCGTPLYSRRPQAPDMLRLRMGSIRTPVDATPTAHIFCHDLPPWAALDDVLPRHAAQEPGRR